MAIVRFEQVPASDSQLRWHSDSGPADSLTNLRAYVSKCMFRQLYTMTEWVSRNLSEKHDLLFPDPG